MRVALCQINPTLGDFAENSKKILAFAENAKKQKADVALFCEMTIFGYHPSDLLERRSIVEQQYEKVVELVKQLPKDLICLFGAAQFNYERGKPFFNSALLVTDGEVKHVFNKQLLPVYDVFDDSRHFAAGNIKENVFTFKNKRVLVLICEDMWGWDPIHDVNPIAEMAPGDVDYVLNLSASPFTWDKRRLRLQFAQQTARHLMAPLAYVNMEGAQDELIFDGGSFAINENGAVIAQNLYFEEDLGIADLENKSGEIKSAPKEDIEHIRLALVKGIKDFYEKVGFRRVHLGLSGGIDSAVVAALAADAVGKENLALMALPSQFNRPESLSLAQDLANNLGCPLQNLPIEDSFASLVKCYEKSFGPKEFSVVHENMQARIRGTLLMAYSNEHHSLLLTTGNKSEYATGYTTLYGDMCGGLAVIGDLLKRQVYELANHYNRHGEVIPQGIIDRAPSAELKPNQQDSDTLPSYDKLDKAVDKLVCEKQAPTNELENWVIERLMISEFKRWQAAPILKVSAHAFGQGRRMPIAHHARI